jgi:Pyrimidine dimer DNA glycosylase
MQTFLPFEDYAKSASVLDRQRLGKQRVESLQVLNALTVPGYGWSNHPAVKMWAGYEFELVAYSVAICDEWISRGYKDTCRDKILAFLDEHDFSTDTPAWLGHETFHRSHRSNLLRKMPEFYGNMFEPDLPNNLEYYWPPDKRV